MDVSWACVKKYAGKKWWRSGGGEAPGPDWILNEMVTYGGGRLVGVMLQVIYLVLRSESSPADWKRSLVVSPHNEEVENSGGLPYVVAWQRCL